jgi:hypothetical protein
LATNHHRFSQAEKQAFYTCIDQEKLKFSSAHRAIGVVADVTPSATAAQGKSDVV